MRRYLTLARARLSSTTFTYSSPRNPSARLWVLSATSLLTMLGSMPRCLATPATCSDAYAVEMSGSRPVPEAQGVQGVSDPGGQGGAPGGCLLSRLADIGEELAYQVGRVGADEWQVQSPKGVDRDVAVEWGPSRGGRVADAAEGVRDQHDDD